MQNPLWYERPTKLNRTKPNWTRLNQTNKTATYGTIWAWDFNGSNSQHRSLCMKQNPRQEQSDRSSSAWRWQLFMDHVMGKSWWRVASEKHHQTYPWPHFRKIQTKTQGLFFSRPHATFIQDAEWELGPFYKCKLRNIFTCVHLVWLKVWGGWQRSPFYGDLERGFEHLYGSSKSESAQSNVWRRGGYKKCLEGRL